jgi:hypothetical protein
MRHEKRFSEPGDKFSSLKGTLFMAWIFCLGLLFSNGAFAETVQLTWDPVQDPQVAVYQVHYSSASGQYDQFVETATNTASVQGLQPGSTYYFAVRACDSAKTNCSGFSNEVSATLPASNNPPNAVNDTASVPEDSVNNTLNVLSNDSDVDGQALTITGASASIGTVSVNSGTLRYSPATNFNGTATLTYTVSDGAGGTDSATVTVSVTAVNDAPQALNDTATVLEDSVNNTLNVLSNDSDVDGQTLTITGASASSGTVSINGSTLRYSPPNNFNGTAALTYTVSDGAGGTDSASVTVTVTSVEEPPAASFTTNTISGTAPLTVLFTDTSTGTITGRTWQFDDGNSETNATMVTHTYTEPGTYTAQLSVNGPGGSDTFVTSTPIVVLSLEDEESDDPEDSDNDGISDEDELAAGRNPHVNEAAVVLNIINTLLY